MLRRLYFLFPDEQSVQSVVDELKNVHVSKKNMHALACEGVQLGSLPVATRQQQLDQSLRIEQLFWNTNLAVFGIALLALLASLFWGFAGWSVVTLCIMAITFTAGAYFASSVPRSHLNEFREAIAHGEILLMVDVPTRRVAQIEDIVHRRHPEAIVGGAGWTIEALGV
jgi:hypothetical protein